MESPAWGFFFFCFDRVIVSGINWSRRFPGVKKWIDKKILDILIVKTGLHPLSASTKSVNYLSNNLFRASRIRLTLLRLRPFLSKTGFYTIRFSSSGFVQQTIFEIKETILAIYPISQRRFVPGNVEFFLFFKTSLKDSIKRVNVSED